MQVRIGYIDSIKGYAILLVVAGHVIQYITQPEGYLNDWFWRYIYSFHMQLFIMVSGFTASSNIQNFSAFTSFCVKRFRQLIIPFAIWTCLMSFWVGDITFILKAVVNPGVGYWFLWDLFYICIAFAASAWISNKKKTNLIIGVVVMFCFLAILSLLIGNKFDVNRICRLFPFYVIGYYLKYLKLNTKTFLNIGGGGYFVSYFTGMFLVPNTISRWCNIISNNQHDIIIHSLSIIYRNCRLSSLFFNL